jgi:cytochrome c
MKKVLSGLAVMVIVLMSTCLCVQAATLEEAKALAIKAAKFVEANGKEKGIAEIGNPKGQFVKGELYVTMQDTNGIHLANPMAPALVGQNHLELKDPTGKYFIKEFIEIVKTKGGGWSDYEWVNPATKKLQAKKAWIQKVEGTDMYVLCGIFQ